MFPQRPSKRKIMDYLIERDGMKCGICKESIEEEIGLYLTWRAFGKVAIKRTKINLDIDHKIPYWLVGGDKWGDLDNLQLVHKTCNKKKGGSIVID